MRGKVLKRETKIKSLYSQDSRTVRTKRYELLDRHDFPFYCGLRHSSLLQCDSETSRFLTSHCPALRQTKNKNHFSPDLRINGNDH